MAAKRKVEENNENFAEFQTKRRENNTQQQPTTSGVTDYYQWYEQRGPWICLFDWTSGHYYYQNLNSYQTQWEKPAEWDSIHPMYAPLGQYHYNDPGESTESSLDKGKRYKQSWNDINSKIKSFLERPARRQIDPEEREKLHWIPEGATEYNIWYDRWVGEHWREGRDHGPSETRCCLETDAGFTKANVCDPGGNKHYFCIYFAKGCCHLGPECGYLHVLPSDKDSKRIDLVRDVFGRERHRLHKDDMGGVGALNKECRTLYVGGLGSREDLEKLLWIEFGEWGEIEDIKIIPKRHIAFVRYKNRVNAEFAKIAMSDQKLNNRELLNVRWAFDDPNPKAQKQELLNSKHRLLEAASDRGLLQEALLRRSQQTGDQVTGPYPNTDNQYPVECGPMTKEQIREAEVLANVYTDCTRLDDALKRMESSQRNSKESDAHLQVTTDNQGAECCENLTDNTTVLNSNWGAYAMYHAGSVPCRNAAETYYSYGFEPTWDSWEESHEFSSTKDPYRKLITSTSISNAEATTKGDEGPN